MAVFLHFGKEISDMMVKHISIEVTSKQTKKPVFGGPADLTAYILEPVDGIWLLVFMFLCFITVWRRMCFLGL